MSATKTTTATVPAEFIRLLACDDRNGYRVLPYCDATGWHERWCWRAAGVERRLADILAVPGRAEYYSLNLFGRGAKGRKADNVVALTAFALDIDLDDKLYGWQLEGYKQELHGFLADIFANEPSLTPTFTIDSGHGLHLVWVLTKSVPTRASGSEPGQRLYDHVWSRMADWIDLVIAPYGLAKLDRAVVCDRARVMRMPGTNNKGVETKLLSCGSTCDLHQLMSVLDTKRVSSRPKRSSASKAVSTSAYDDLFLDLRLGSIVNYVTAHRGEVVGHRNTLCYLYANALRGLYGSAEPSAQRRYLEELNEMFIWPLKGSELDTIERSVDRFVAANGHPRKFGIDWIKEKLDLTEREARAWFGGEVKRTTKAHRKRLAKAERDETIRDMAAKGYSQAEIAAAVGVSVSTVSRRLRGGVSAKQLKTTRDEKAAQMAAQGLSQTEIAEELACSRQTVARSLARNVQNCKNNYDQGDGSRRCECQEEGGAAPSGGPCASASVYGGRLVAATSATASSPPVGCEVGEGCDKGVLSDLAGVSLSSSG